VYSSNDPIIAKQFLKRLLKIDDQLEDSLNGTDSEYELEEWASSSSSSSSSSLPAANEAVIDTDSDVQLEDSPCAFQESPPLTPAIALYWTPSELPLPPSTSLDIFSKTTFEK